MSTGAPATPAPVFAVRIVSLDHYMARPEPGLDVCYSELEGGVVERVPVVRIFGATPMGQKTCLHLHKVRAAALCRLCASYQSHAAARHVELSNLKVLSVTKACCVRRPSRTSMCHTRTTRPAT